MLKVYYLKTEVRDNIEYIKGEQHIHRAILEVEGNLRKLIQDTTPEEDSALTALASKVREPTTEEKSRFQAFLLELPSEPARDLIKEIDALKARIEALEKKGIG